MRHKVIKGKRMEEKRRLNDIILKLHERMNATFKL